MDIPDNKFQERLPAAWSPACPDGDIGGGVRRVIPAFGQRVEEACNKLGQILQLEARSPTGARAAVLRVTPNGGLRDSVEAMSWAPQDWLKQDTAPEGLCSFGSPWLLAGFPGSARIGPNSWPVPGMGQFLIQVSGSAFVITFPYGSSLERGAAMQGTEEWLT